MGGPGTALSYGIRLRMGPGENRCGGRRQPARESGIRAGAVSGGCLTNTLPVPVKGTGAAIGALAVIIGR